MYMHVSFNLDHSEENWKNQTNKKDKVTRELFFQISMSIVCESWFPVQEYPISSFIGSDEYIAGRAKC